MKKAVGYVRTSTKRQKQSPFAQRSEIEDWCKKHNVCLVGIFEDIGISGAKPIEKRPGLRDALNVIQNHKADYLVVYDMSRLARDARLGSKIRYILAISQAEPIYILDDYTDDGLKFQKQILACVQEEVRKLVSNPEELKKFLGTNYDD